MKQKANEVKLTVKQKRFADNYIITLNATSAAIQAGYSAKTARVIGGENLSKPAIQAYLQQRMNPKDKKTVATGEEVLEYLTSVMRRTQKECVITRNKDGEPTVMQIPAKLIDANKAAELLGKRHGLFETKEENPDIEDLTPLSELLK
ncbi:MAG TPA: terminase small subunit [Clostridiales bacterium]|nr:terminase small subunit [Clostridiales bacterium]